MNPLLVREVQPPLIYVGGEGRLKKTESKNTSTTFYCFYFRSSFIFVALLEKHPSLLSVIEETLFVALLVKHPPLAAKV